MRRGGAGVQGSRGEEEAPSRASASPLSRFFALLQGAGVALIALWLYRSALGLAYFNDDPTGHFAWMEGRTVVDFLTGSAAYGYYRPVVFILLRLFAGLFGGGDWPHNPFADHALLLLLHAANAALVWALARSLARASGRRGADGLAWTAALVFAALPFSYEAVAYVASLTHPLVTFWLLLTLLGIRSYELGIGAADQRPNHAPPATDRSSLATRHSPLATRHSPPATSLWPLLPMALALLTHENGLLALPALVGVDWLRRPGDGWRARARRLWPYALLAALYVLLWLAIPKNSSQGLNAPGDIARNAVPFLQTLVFPLLPILRLGAEDVGALAVAAVAVLAVTGWLARAAGAGRLWVFAVGWLALSALPSLLFLGPAYVYGSPRLSYLPGVAIGLLWGLPLLWLARRGLPAARRAAWPGPLAAGLVAVYLLALLWPARPFVACQLDFYAETSRLARQMGQLGGQAPAGRELVFVNAPFFFSSTAARPAGCPSPYPWTPVGGVLLPPYAQARDFVRFNGGPDRAATGVAFAGYGPGWRTFGPEIDGDGLRAAAAGSAVYVFDLARGEFLDLPAAWRPGGASAGAARATFGETLALVGGAAVATGDRVYVQLDWRVLAPPAFLPTVFVHVYDATGALAAQSDGPIAGGLAPFDLWAPGDGLADTRMVDLSALPPGAYTVAAGVYNPAGGARLPAERDGRPLADDVFPLGSFMK